MAHLELTQVEVRVMATLEDREPQSLTELTREVGFGTTRALAELEKWKLVELRVGRWIHLTTRGRAWLRGGL